MELKLTPRRPGFWATAIEIAKEAQGAGIRTAEERCGGLSPPPPKHWGPLAVPSPSELPLLPRGYLKTGVWLTSQKLKPKPPNISSQLRFSKHNPTFLVVYVLDQRARRFLGTAVLQGLATEKPKPEMSRAKQTSMHMKSLPARQHPPQWLFVAVQRYTFEIK